MKRLIFVLFLFLISVSVFAEDYIIDEKQPKQNPSDVIEMAQLQAQLINLNKKMDLINKNFISKSDINLMKEELFLEANNMFNYFLAQLLLLLGAVIVFVFASLFVMKAKKWL